jgi:hypothetical protein
MILKHAFCQPAYQARRHALTGKETALADFMAAIPSHILWTGQPLAYPAVQKSEAAAHLE